MIEEERKKVLEQVEKAKKEMEKHSIGCIKEILDIFKKRKLQNIVVYQILNRITDAMETRDPALKISKIITRMILREQQENKPIEEGANKMKFKVETLPEKTKIKCDCKPPEQAILKVTFPDGKEIYLCRVAYKIEMEDIMKKEHEAKFE